MSRPASRAMRETAMRVTGERMLAAVPRSEPTPELDPRLANARREFELLGWMKRTGFRSALRQVTDDVFECRLFNLEAGRRYLIAKERGNTPGTAVQAAVMVAKHPGAIEDGMRGHPYRLAQVRPDLAQYIAGCPDLDAWSEEADQEAGDEPGANVGEPTPPQPAPRAGRGMARDRRTRAAIAAADPRAQAAPAPPSPQRRHTVATASPRATRANAGALLAFVVETVDAGGTWSILKMMQAAKDAGQDDRNLQVRVALRDAASNGLIVRVERGMYASIEAGA